MFWTLLDPHLNSGLDPKLDPNLDPNLDTDLDPDLDPILDLILTLLLYPAQIAIKPPGSDTCPVTIQASTTD